jgi:serine/threonine protein phosphatase 1
MFSKLLKRTALTKAPVSPAVPDGVVAWAVGDIHGRLDLLSPLVDAIQADADKCGHPRQVVIFLGDYIDRGPESRGVLKYLASLPKHPLLEWRFLKGNHEEAMLDFLDDPSKGPTWCEYGGTATLQSYGLQPPQMKHRSEAWVHLAADLDHKVTPMERAFLENLELSVTVGDYFFAHAGARPGESLDRQVAKDLMWIRGSFLNSEVEFEKVVVHGHTPVSQLYADGRRIGVDTRAYESGVLSALRLEGRSRVVIQSVEENGHYTMRSSTAPFGKAAQAVG